MNCNGGKLSIFSLRRGEEARSVEDALDAVHMNEKLRQATCVVLKPNLTYPFYKPGVTTSPAITLAVARYCRRFTERVCIVESNGGSNAWTAEEAFAGHGLREGCRDSRIELVNLSNSRSRRVSIALKDGRSVVVSLPELLLDECDLFVSIPVPKVHVMTHRSFGMKNLWGCVPDVKRLRLHYIFEEVVCALVSLIRPQISVLDGTYFLTRRGPMDGVPIRRNLVAAGDFGSMEVFCCAITGADIKQVEHLRLAQEQGLIPAGLENIRIVGQMPPVVNMEIERKAMDVVTKLVFRSAAMTRILYDSPVAKAIHEILYAFRGRPKDFQPKW